jgi:3-deoxy-manno-octulosonate cytidylyltransferase (CMP-KDO synthetase)
MKTSGNIVAIIPARYGSTRLPAKPLVDLCGKPMVQRVVEQAQQSRLVGRVLVATDDERIARVVRGFGGEVALTSPDLRTGSDRIAAVASTLADGDIIVNVQGDEPLIPPQMIDEVLQPLVDDSSIAVGTAVRILTSSEELSNPNTVKVVIDQDGNGMYFSRSPIPYLRDAAEIDRWHLHHLYYKHFGLYAYRKEILIEFSRWEESKLERAEKLEQLRFLEHGIKIRTVVTECESIPIDTAADAERVRTVLRGREAAGGTKK